MSSVIKLSRPVLPIVRAFDVLQKLVFEFLRHGVSRSQSSSGGKSILELGIEHLAVLEVLN